MGIIDFMKKQFVDVIDWTESTDDVLAMRYPMADREIRNGAKLTVRDSQIALFVNEGKIADLFVPGLYTLTTQTLPVLTYLNNWDKAFQSPFKSDVIFFSTREKIGQKWGTPAPITVRDKEFGTIRLRAFGTYSYKIRDPQNFYKKLSGTRELFTVNDLDSQLKAMVATSLASFFGNSQLAFIDMASNQTKFSESLKEALSIPFANYGLSLESFFVENISLPEEVQTYLDKASSMKVLGDLDKYTQFQTADAIGNAAKNEGGIAGVGVGMGAGVALGQAMTGALAGAGSTSARGPDAHDAHGAQSAQDAVAMLGKLHELLTQGVLSQQEFDSKKQELLKKIT